MISEPILLDYIVNVSYYTVILKIIGTIGTAGGTGYVIEYAGEIIKNLSMEERMTICNMTIEAGARAGLIAPDNKTADFLTNIGANPGNWKIFFTDDKAIGIEKHNFNASILEPQVATPHSPSNSLPVSEIENTKVEIAYIGACTGAKYEDLNIASKILKNSTTVRFELTREIPTDFKSVALTTRPSCQI